jgi:hypothetical protein
MPNWKNLLNEIKEAGSTFDVVRRKYLKVAGDIKCKNKIYVSRATYQKTKLRTCNIEI